MKGLFAGLLVLACSNAIAGRAVIVMTHDGAGFEQIKKFDASFLTKNRVRPLIPAFPSLTFPAHVTMVTGVPPFLHGVVANQYMDGRVFRDFESPVDVMQAPPLWVQARFWPGVRVETFLWPLSYAPWRGVSPNQASPSFSRQSFSQIANHVLESLRAWKGDQDLLIFSWTPGIDKEGHTYGTYADQTRAAWRKFTEELEAFETELRKIEKDVVVIHASDHGMADVKNALDAGVWLKKNRIRGKFVTSGPVLMVYDQKKIPVDPDFPVTWMKPQHERQGASWAIAAQGMVFRDKASSDKSCKGVDPAKPWLFECADPKGMHGWNADTDPQMLASLWTWPIDQRIAAMPSNHEEFPHFVWTALRQKE